MVCVPFFLYQSQIMFSTTSQWEIKPLTMKEKKQY